MRVVHATDIHWMVPPPLRRIPGKRLIGSFNLYVVGRRHHFSETVQSALVQTLIDLQPDAALITGDLTAQALPEEFDIAAHALRPLLERVPTLIQCGNHDVYTLGSRHDRRLQQHFGPWMHLDAHGLARWTTGRMTVVGLDPNRPHPVASGLIPVEQLQALPAALAAAPTDHHLVLALHYPILDRHGAVYDGFEHGLLNARALIDVLRGCARRPDLIVHGHIHHGFRVNLDLDDAQVPICNAGSSGYAYIPEQHRAACFNLYTLLPGQAPQVERYRYDGERFAPEPGGAYASGR